MLDDLLKSVATIHAITTDAVSAGPGIAGVERVNAWKMQI